MRNLPKAPSPKCLRTTLHSGQASGVSQIQFFHVCVGWFPRLIPEMGPFQFPSPRGPVPICFGLGFSMRIRERGLLSPCGSLRPFPPSHLQARCLTALLSVSLLGVSWLLILGAMSQSPFGKGMLPFNFSKKWFLSLSFPPPPPQSLSPFLKLFSCEMYYELLTTDFLINSLN